MNLSFKKAAIISIALENEGFPGMFGYLFRGIEPERAAVEGIRAYEARVRYEEGIHRTARSFDPSVLLQLDGPPELRNDLLIYKFKPDADLYRFNSSSEVKEHILSQSTYKPVMVLDMQNVKLIGEVFLGALIGLHRSMAECGHRLALINLRPDPLNRIRTCKLDKILDVFPSLSALESAQAMGRL